MNGDRKPGQTPANPRNRGFTLIELLIVISIIGLLIGLLIPAVMAVMRKARDAEVRTEIANLDKAITTFQAEYGGITPPSSITFPATPSGWDDALRAGDKAIIRRIWPQFDFTTNGGNTGLTGSLDGAECLVFFLGGILVESGGNKSLVGFSKDPAEPFKTGGNRVGPFYEFDIGRLTATGSGSSGNEDAPEYLDPLAGQTNPYVYFSSYDGRGYQSGDSGNIDEYTQSGGGAFKPNSFQIISPGSDHAYGSGGIYDSKNYDAPSDDDEDNITNFTTGRLTP